MTVVADCPFCSFDDPAVTVYRDASIQALISRAPINRYHVLVVPRPHVEHLSEVPAEMLEIGRASCRERV